MPLLHQLASTGAHSPVRPLCQHDGKGVHVGASWGVCPDLKPKQSKERERERDGLPYQQRSRGKHPNLVFTPPQSPITNGGP